MADRAAPIDDATMNFGLLMESAQAHQKLADAHLDKLRAHTQDLDGVVRDEIRRTLIDELQMLTAESKRATDALARVGRRAAMQGALWNVLTAILCTALPVAILRWSLPSSSEVDALRIRRDELAARVAALERQGGRIEWRRCGGAAHLCVRIDRKAPAYGEKADYLVVHGY